jgi:hypothetical protein
MHFCCSTGRYKCGGGGGDGRGTWFFCKTPRTSRASGVPPAPTAVLLRARDCEQRGMLQKLVTAFRLFCSLVLRLVVGCKADTVCSTAFGT